MHALRIDPDATVTDLNLPGVDAQSAIQEYIGSDAVDHGVYHRRAVLHIHGNGQNLGLPQNLAAWALASAWRGMPLYPLAGPIVVTGRTESGDVTALDDDLVQHTKAVAQTVRDTLSEWRARPPPTRPPSTNFSCTQRATWPLAGSDGLRPGHSPTRGPYASTYPSR